MELRQLQYFVKVARKQHVTDAAKELFVAQSAVSRQIRQLETELGLQLFVRKGRNLQLTSVGRLFLSRVESILTDLEMAVLEMRDFLDPELGEIRLGFPHSIGANVVPGIVAEFRKLHPNVKFHFKQGMYNSLIQDVIQGEMDLAFISPSPQDHEQVTGEILLTEELFAILPPNHVLAEYQAIRLEQLEEESFVLFRDGYSLRPIVWDACMRAGFKPMISFESEETDTIRGLVAAGMGVSLLPEMALIDISPLQPAMVRISEPRVTRTVGLIRRTEGKLPLVAEVFHQFILEYFRSK